MARYSTDSAWLVPHFEKMLYDNALLVSVLCEAFGLTKAPWLERAIRDVLSFAEREWLVAEGGFCAAWDADSEGVEGKYYTWTKAEIDALLGEDTHRFCRLFGVTEAGNWEGVNILHRLTLSPEDQDLFERSRSRLLAAEKRIRPPLDDKQLLSWNALMNKAFSQAFARTGETTLPRSGHPAYGRHAPELPAHRGPRARLQGGHPPIPRVFGRLRVPDPGTGFAPGGHGRSCLPPRGQAPGRNTSLPILANRPPATFILPIRPKKGCCSGKRRSMTGRPRPETPSWPGTCGTSP